MHRWVLSLARHRGKMYKHKNVLIAGGAGLVGQSLIGKLLAEGAHVRATQYKSRRISITHKNLEIVSCDLKNQDDARSVFKNMDIVFLAAAKVGGAKLNLEDPSSLIMYNLGLSANLIALASGARLDRCAFISSSFVYPNTQKPHVESEGFLGDPPVYGLGWVKRYLETLCKHFHMTSDTKYSIVRPTAYYGPHDNFNIEECHVIPALIMKAINCMNPFEVWGNGEELRCFTYVDDFVDGLMLAAEKHAVADAINICTREVHTIKNVVSIILECMNFKPTIVYCPDKPSSIPWVVCDPSKAERILGWKAKTSLEDGIKKTIRGVPSLA